MLNTLSLSELQDILQYRKRQLSEVETEREKLRHECRSISDTIAILSKQDEPKNPR